MATIKFDISDRKKEAFKVLCHMENTSMNAALRSHIDKLLNEDEPERLQREADVAKIHENRAKRRRGNFR